MSFDPKKYGEVCAHWIAFEHPTSLGPGKANRSIASQLLLLTEGALFEGKKVVRHDMAQACLCAILLRLDYLAQSHSISQHIENTTGSFWHGIMHRREADYPNSKYWFRNVGNHPVFPELGAYAASLAHEMDIDTSKFEGAWAPFTYIDRVSECINTGSPEETLCKRIQEKEWELLFDYSYTHAIGI